MDLEVDAIAVVATNQPDLGNGVLGRAVVEDMYRDDIYFGESRN